MTPTVLAVVTRTGVLDSVSARHPLTPSTLRPMIEEEESAEASGPGAVTRDDMAAALEEMRASSPEMSQALDNAGVTPDSLTDAHDAATGSEDDNSGE